LPGRFDGKVFEDISDLLRSPSLWGSIFEVTAEAGAELHICLSAHYLRRRSSQSISRKGVFIFPAAALAADARVATSDVISLGVSNSSNCEVSLSATIKAGVHGNQFLVIPFQLQNPEPIKPAVAAGEDEFWLTVTSSVAVCLQENMDKYHVSCVLESGFRHAADYDDAPIPYIPVEFEIPSKSSPSEHLLDSWDVVHRCREATLRLHTLSERYDQQKLPGFVASVNIVACDFRIDKFLQSHNSNVQTFSLQISTAISGIDKDAFEAPDLILNKSTCSYLQIALATALEINYKCISVKSVMNRLQHNAQAIESVFVDLEISGLDQIFCKDAIGLLHSFDFATVMQKLCESHYLEKRIELQSMCVFVDPDESLVLSAEKIASETILRPSASSTAVVWKRQAQIFKKHGSPCTTRRLSANLTSQFKSENLAEENFDHFESNQDLHSHGIVAQNLKTPFGTLRGAAVRGPCGTKTVYEGLALCLPTHVTRRAAFLRSLFVGPPLEDCAQYGVYSLQLFIRGKRTVITIDDRIPVDLEGSFLFMSCENAEDGWAPLIEKALAKVLGGYVSLRKCSPHQIAQILSGAVHQIFYFDNYNSLAPESNGDDFAQGTRRICNTLYSDGILEDAAFHSFKMYESLQITLCEYIISRTCAQMHCGRTEAVLRNMDRYDTIDAVNSILSKHLMEGGIIGVWKRMQTMSRLNQPTWVQPGHVYRIQDTKTINGVVFYQVDILKVLHAT
jgi:hypothetical protein